MTDKLKDITATYTLVAKTGAKWDYDSMLKVIGDLILMVENERAEKTHQLAATFHLTNRMVGVEKKLRAVVAASRKLEITGPTAFGVAEYWHALEELDKAERAGS